MSGLYSPRGSSCLAGIIAYDTDAGITRLRPQAVVRGQLFHLPASVMKPQLQIIVKHYRKES